MSSLGGDDGEAAAAQSGIFGAGGGGGDADSASDHTNSTVEPNEQVTDATQSGQRANTFEDYLKATNPILVPPRCLRTQTQSFRLSLWMSDNFPLSLRDQVGWGARSL